MDKQELMKFYIHRHKAYDILMKLMLIQFAIGIICTAYAALALSSIQGSLIGGAVSAISITIWYNLSNMSISNLEALYKLEEIIEEEKRYGNIITFHR